MTIDQLEALILQNLADQFSQLVVQYTARAADDTPALEAAIAAFEKLRQLLEILEKGLANLKLQAQRAAEYAAD